MKELLESVYKGKKVFLTGHTGFKGSWLLKWFQLLGADVVAYSLSPEKEQCHYNVIHGDDLCKSIIGNICDAEKLNAAIKDFQPDFIFHLAAQALVKASYDDPITTYQSNVIGTGNVILAAKLVEKACTTVIITTDKVYHNNEWEFPYRENDRLGGFDPYSSSKACSELISSSFINSFFHESNYDDHKKQFATARAGNVIGGGDWADNRIVPDIIRGIEAGETIVLRNPGAVRPWQHVLEPLSGYLLLGAKMYQEPLKYTGAWNFGPENKQFLTVEDLTTRCIEIWGQGNYESPELTGQPHEANMLQLDISKAKFHLKWKPKFDDNQTFEQTIQWYKAYYSNPNTVATVTEDQINHFMK